MINIASTHDTANDHYAKIAFKKKSKMGQPTSPKIQAFIPILTLLFLNSHNMFSCQS